MAAKRKVKLAKLKRRSGTHPNPCHKKGERNIFCPHYCNCLDFAIKKSWDFWACLDCRFKENRQYMEDFPYTNGDAVLYHSLPPEIFLKVG